MSSSGDGVAVARIEARRLASLHGAEILDTPREAVFDDIVALARMTTGAAMALVSLVDADRQWFKAREGFALAETPRSIAFCDHAVRAQDLLVVPDASSDPRFANNPLVTGPPYVRFYAGAPILLDGHAIGTVCVLDPQPRERFADAGALEALARQASALIAARRETQAQIDARAAAAREFESFWTLAHELMLVCDHAGTVIVANPAWTDAFGSFSQPDGVRMTQFLADPAARVDLSGVADGAAHAFVAEYRGVDGVIRTIGWTLRRAGALFYAIGRDDTALRAAERDLARAQRMESIGQLTGGIAHDFNNLLTIVIGNLDIATRWLAKGDGDRATRAIADAGEGASRAATLTQRLLAFAGRQQLAPRAVDPVALIADIRPLIERSASETVTIEIPAPVEPVWPIEVDVGQLENAILNLAVNARDAMADGLGPSVLTIAIRNIVLGDGQHGDARAGDHVRITVADTGTGMAADVLARAREPFYTTKGVGRGTGLGLSQVDGFVRQSGGFVTIDSEAGRGTSVHLWLPRSLAALLPVDVPPAPSNRPKGEACVMVVEDNDDLRELVVETLREAGYRVIEAHDGRAALSLFARQSPSPDLVLSDVMMPGLDGFRLAAEIRARSTSRVLLMTGYAGRADASGEPVLVKPFTPVELLDRVATTIAEIADVAA